jgi:hypothetical protein
MRINPDVVRVNAADVAQLDLWAERVLSASTLADVLRSDDGEMERYPRVSATEVELPRARRGGGGRRFMGRAGTKAGLLSALFGKLVDCHEQRRSPP